MPIAEFQPYSSGKYCSCGAELILCDDWEKGRWIGGDPYCLHEINDESIHNIDMMSYKLRITTSDSEIPGR